jgi:putative ABC transport system permease protein
MTARPPRLAGWLLRCQPLGSRRPEVEADLLELFEARLRSQGERYARRRYYADVFSLLRHHTMTTKPTATTRALVPTHEESRLSQVWRFRAREIWQDLSYGVRLLRRSPAVVAVTIAGLGLAIGVSTSVFSLINAAVLRPSGIDDPATAVRVSRAYAQGLGTDWPHSTFAQLRDAATSTTVVAQLSGSAAFSDRSDADSTESASVMFVSGAYLTALTGKVTAGRLLTPDDDVIGAPGAVVVSHRFWSRRLGGDLSRVGREIWINGAPFTVVGVSDRAFAGTSESAPAFWAPLGSYHLVYGGAPLSASASARVTVFGRVRPGVPPRQAEAELSAIAAGIQNDLPESNSGPVTGVRFSRADRSVGPSMARRIALVVGVIVIVIGLVLLLACVNVTNLLLASALTRRRELGLRVALGASRARVVRQLLTESLALGMASGAIGLLFTIWLVPALTTFMGVPMMLDAAPDFRVYMFLAAIASIAGLGAGLTPARHAMRGDLVSPLKGADGGSSAARSNGIRAALIGLQAAGSVTLLVLAALLTRAMIRSTQVDVGFDANRLLVVSPALGRGMSEDQVEAYWQLARERVGSVPGVRLASLASTPPYEGASQVTIFRRAGSRYTIYHHHTESDYFATLGLRAIRGRTYTAIARDFFAGEDPIGQSMDRVLEGSRDRVIGVVSNAITARLRELSTAAVYQPMRDRRAARLVIRTDVSPESLIPAVRTALEPVDRRIRLEMRSVSDGLRQQLSEPRLLASLAGILACLALSLAVVGIYGVTAFVVGQRTHEIGVRIALGAGSREVMRLLLADSLRPVVIGLALGLGAAPLGSRVFSGVLYGVSSADPIAFVGASLVLLAAATVAVIVPTRRAASVDAATTLRQL